MSDHEQKSIVSVERSGKDTGIGASLHRLVHMDVLLTHICKAFLEYVNVHSCEFTLVSLFVCSCCTCLFTLKFVDEKFLASLPLLGFQTKLPSPFRTTCHHCLCWWWFWIFSSSFLILNFLLSFSCLISFIIEAEVMIIFLQCVCQSSSCGPFGDCWLLIVLYWESQWWEIDLLFLIWVWTSACPQLSSERWYSRFPPCDWYISPILPIYLKWRDTWSKGENESHLIHDG